MKTTLRNRRPGAAAVLAAREDARRAAKRPTTRRGGAVIIIVLSLMAALTFLGFFYYEFTVLERSTAGNFADIGAISAEDFTPESAFDDGLEQVIVGTRTTHLDSALYGNKYSLLANLIGIISPDGLVPANLNPHSGGGVRIRYMDGDRNYNGLYTDGGDTAPDGYPDDANTGRANDGVPDALLFDYGAGGVASLEDKTGAPTFPNRPIFNFSRAANAGNVDGSSASHSPLPFPFRPGAASITYPNFEPDAGYTYPDLNSMFLSYKSQFVTRSGGAAVEIFIPSFSRPQYFIDRRGTLGAFAGLYRDDAADSMTGSTRNLVLRPHVSHRRFNVAGVDQGARFLDANSQARSGDTSRLLRRFTFEVNKNSDGFVNSQSLFSERDSAAFGPYDLDIDTDNDGIEDAIAMDLDYPIITFDDGRQAVPLYGFQIVDADALFNANVHGNQNGLARQTKELNLNVSAVTPGTPRALAKSSFDADDPSRARAPLYDVWATGSPASAYSDVMRRQPVFPAAVNQEGRSIGETPNLNALDATLPNERMESISASGFGLSPYEINPWYGLSAWMQDNDDTNGPSNYYAQQFRAYLADTTLPHLRMFGRFPTEDPSTNPGEINLFSRSVAQQELANMELLMLMNGHTGADGVQRISGRHGEAGERAKNTVSVDTFVKKLQPMVLASSDNSGSLLPQAGRSYTGDADGDDDRNFHVGVSQQIAAGDPRWTPGMQAGNVFPNDIRLDITGGDRDINAREVGAAHAPVRLESTNNFPLIVPPNVHPLPLLGVKDPFADPTIFGTNGTAAGWTTNTQRTLELTNGLVGQPGYTLYGQPGSNVQSEYTAAVWPRYSHYNREWFYRNYEQASRAPGYQDTSNAVLNGMPSLANTMFQGVAPYEVSAAGLSDDIGGATIAAPSPTIATAIPNFRRYFDQFDLVGEETEAVVGVPGFSYDGDTHFSPSEMAALHLSPADYAASGATSRLRELAKINFDLDPSAERIRSRFTTDSHDRLEFHVSPNSLQYNSLPVRPWEFNRWEFLDDPGAPGTPFVPSYLKQFGRTATAEIDADGVLHEGPIGRIDGMFPPVFADVFGVTATNADDIPNDVATAAGATAVLAFAPTDPFRNVLRATLATPSSSIQKRVVSGAAVPNPFATRNSGLNENITLNQNVRASARKKMRFDRVLADIDLSTGEPIYRDLVPHPDFSNPPFDAVTGTITIPPIEHESYNLFAINFDVVSEGGTLNARAIAQEYWARKDRQNLARDIYVLLYTLCGPDGWDPTTIDPASIPAGPLQTAVQNHVRMSAQFAVNVVDALDRDSVITEFSYDPNLSDGWDIDPAASAEDGSNGTTRLSVYGVEASTLSISEVLLVRTQKLASDSADTNWDDAQGQQMAFVELRNSSPFDVELYSNSWRMEVCYDNADISSGNAEHAVFDFNHDTANFTRSGSAFKRVQAGANFIISDTTDLSEVAAAVVDRTNSGNPQYFVCPKAPDGNNPANILVTTGTGSSNARDNDVGLDLASTDSRHEPFRTFATTFPEMGARSAPDVDHIVIPADGSGDVLTGDVTYTVRLWRRPNHKDPNDVLDTGNEAWILVDEMVHQSRDRGTVAASWGILNPANSGTDINDGTGLNPGGGTINANLADVLYSTERAEPFGSLVGPTVNTSGDTVVDTRAADKGPGDQTTSFIVAGDLRKHTISAEYPDGAGALADDMHWANSNLDPANTTRQDVKFTRWHTHFDRDLLSPGELLAMPVFSSVSRTTTTFPVDTASPGNAELTDTVNASDGSEDILFRQMLVDQPTNGTTLDVRRAYELVSGSSYYPEASTVRNDPNTVRGYIDSAFLNTYSNRWQRLFDFVEVPSRVNGPLRDFEESNGVELYHVRTPGKINLNTLRDQEVLAGLIDDPTHLNTLRGFGEAALGNFDHVRLGDDLVEPDLLGVGGSLRNWWQEFLVARDGIDPFRQIPIPGVPGCRPFEPASNLLDLPDHLAVERSMMRRGAEWVEDRVGPILPGERTQRMADGEITTPGTSEQDELAGMGLFEARSTLDIVLDAVDPWTRERLLSKVMNNGTNRSNVFIIWMAVQLHEADHGYQPNGAPDYEDVRIGAAMDDFPVYRTFCVVDRSLIEQAYNDPDPTDGVPGTFDFRKFIIHRQRLR